MTAIALPPLSTAYTYALYASEKLAEYAGKLLNRTYVFIQTQPGACLALIGVNLIAFEIALVICRIAFDVFCKNEPEADQHEKKYSWGLVLLFTAIVGGTIYTCYNKFNLPLPVWKVTSLSLVTGLVYLCYKTR